MFEFLSAFIGERLFHRIRFHLNVPKDMTISFWSDSIVVRYWIKNKSRKLRMSGEISDPDCWKHCPENENPADTLSRGRNLISLNGQEFCHG